MPDSFPTWTPYGTVSRIADKRAPARTGNGKAGLPAFSPFSPYHQEKEQRECPYAKQQPTHDPRGERAVIPLGHEAAGNPVKKVNKERRPDKHRKVKSLVKET